jgi:5-formyltetrahydrofolate cyclo-ligase
LLPRPFSPCDPAQAVAFFASTDDELDTRPLDALLVSRGIARAVPRFDEGGLHFHLVSGPVHDLPRDRFGIPTPGRSDEEVGLGDVALVVVPGLGFDVFGGRIGYGKGFYDRALAGVDRGRVVAVFLDEQEVARVPMGPGDLRLPRLCTPARGVVDVDK